MKTRIRITAFALAALVMVLAMSTAMAATSSTTINKGQYDKYGSYVTLSTNNVSCRGASSAGSSTSNIMSSNLLTKGTSQEVLRSYRNLSAGQTANWEWSNSSNLTGTFRVWLCCNYGNHQGSGAMWQ